MSPLPRALALIAVLGGATALAQGASGDREVDLVRARFEVGSYREALQRGREAMASQNFSEPQRIELNKYTGLSAFILGDLASAEEHLHHLLELNPDYVLDPFACPPAAIKFFEELRKKYADSLSLVRQKITLREEEKARLAAEAQRRSIEQSSAPLTVKTIERRSFALNFVPFGAGQFQQGRNRLGVALATAQSVLGASSLMAYLAIESLKERRETQVRGIEGLVEHVDDGIPANRQAERDNWRVVKYASAAAFYAIYAYGVTDALLHHQDEVVSEVPAVRRSAPAQLSLYPTSGGAGVGVFLSF
jgi:hypothetical protein